MTGAGEAPERRCPLCGAPSAPESSPFCSRRCRLRDLGRWIGTDEPYVIPGDAAPAGRDLSRDRDGGGEGA